ncbi:MAG: energy-coupling factor transporter transmembrane component T [Microbacterium sp.]
MISLYRPGTSILHRMSAGAKLALVAVLALVISLWSHTWVAATVALALVFALFALGGFGPLTWARQLWSLAWLIVLLAVFQLVFADPFAAYINTVRVVSIILLASLLSLTTPTSALIETLQTVLGPLRRIGVDPWRVAFTLQLTITLVPVVADFLRRIREAYRARGLRPGIRMVVPLLVMSLRHADDVADALTARGIA